MNAHYALVARRASHRCEYCRAPEAIFNFPFEVEHVIPACRDGLNDESNLALACRACNLHKADHLTATDETTGEEVRLFNPREDLWEKHFAVEPDTSSIRGLTAIGQVTVACLQVNSPVQREARRLWMRLGLFP